MNKRKFLIIAIIILVIVIFIIRYVKYNKLEVINNSLKKIDIRLEEFNLLNRSKLYINQELVIGENVKQLENGYYDFKISNKGDAIIIALNKLWYENYNENYIQDEYLAKICREVARCTNINIDKYKLEYELYKYIKNNYLVVKQGGEGEKIVVDNIEINSESINNECIVYIRVE